MSLSIQTNVASLIAQQSLNQNSAALNTSLQRLSTGLKINTGADGPAAYVISQQEGAQITGLQTAIDNTSNAVNLVQTGEGALNEISSLLNQIRGLALNSANAGVNNPDALAANQAQINNALSTINNIANTTTFGNKNLLNGSAGSTASYGATTNGASLTSAVGNNSTQSGSYQVQITQQGLAATPVTGGTAATATTTETAADTLTITDADLNGGSLVVNLAKGDSIYDAAAKLQTSLNSANLNNTLGGISAAGKFTVTVDASTPGSPTIDITNNDATTGNSDLTVVSGTANTKTVTGLNTGAGTKYTAGTGIGGTGASVAGYINTSGAELTVSGGILTSPVTVNLAVGDDIKATATKLQTALDNATAQGGGKGKFTVALNNAGTDIVVTSNALGGTKLQISADSATTTAATGFDTTADQSSTAGQALQGTINGQSYTGGGALGNVLTADAAAGNANGLSATVGITSGATAATGITNVNVADGLVFQIGANANDTASVSIQSVLTTSLGQNVAGLNNPNTTSLASINVTDSNDSQDAINVVDQAIKDISNLSASLGAFQDNTLQANAANLQTTLQNTTEAQSTIRDTDFAAQTAAYTNEQVLEQAGTQVLKNANQSSQLILTLLQP